MGNIGSCHVAANQDGVGVVRADGRMEHCPTSSGANDLEITRAGATRYSQQQRPNGKLKKGKDHLLFLFFAFVPVVSLSFWQKALALSISLKELLDSGELLDLNPQEPGRIFIINLLQYSVG